MKTILLITLMIMPLTSQAICLRNFTAEGEGDTKKEAQESLYEYAASMCGSDEYAWAELRSAIKFTSADQKIRTSATFQCCMQW